jgi:hypothetical protein
VRLCRYQKSWLSSAKPLARTRCDGHHSNRQAVAESILSGQERSLQEAHSAESRVCARVRTFNVGSRGFPDWHDQRTHLQLPPMGNKNTACATLSLGFRDLRNITKSTCWKHSSFVIRRFATAKSESRFLFQLEFLMEPPRLPIVGPDRPVAVSRAPVMYFTS